MRKTICAGLVAVLFAPVMAAAQALVSIPSQRGSAPDALQEMPVYLAEAANSLRASPAACGSGSAISAGL